jgi:hypothetical protein
MHSYHPVLLLFQLLNASIVVLLYYDLVGAYHKASMLNQIQTHSSQIDTNQC